MSFILPVIGNQGGKEKKTSGYSSFPSSEFSRVLRVSSLVFPLRDLPSPHNHSPLPLGCGRAMIGLNDLLNEFKLQLSQQLAQQLKGERAVANQHLEKLVASMVNSQSQFLSRQPQLAPQISTALNHHASPNFHLVPPPVTSYLHHCKTPL
ncbi:hypothetical protein Salat_0193200 [Sesamum alatum]|uniref:Uncharacterized protein n=1 Tax=Sesamum alatum TaxID=300844 RepID=A0AAE2CXV6_9LAMI|nr:hypothetical protein Salat_0193200 [Sesamum alatum]